MPIENTSAQLVVVGAGPGGYAAAFRAADLGMQVTLIDSEENPGGVCLFRGCIPSKALLHVAKVVAEAEEAHDWGIEFKAPKIRSEKLQAWKESVVQKLTGGLGQLAKQRKINYIRGHASFVDAHHLRVTQHQGDTLLIEFENAVLAAGSRPFMPEAWPIHSPHLLNSTGALALKQIPKTMLVVGGGYIGLELGSVYATLGSKVTVVEMTDGFLPGVDRDLVAPVAKRLEKLFSAIYLNTKVEAMQEHRKGIRVEFSSAQGKKEEVFEKVLVAIGRKPNSSGMGLNNTSIEITEKGFVKVNESRQTSEPHIYAIGDLTGEPMLAHKAAHEARVAVESIYGHDVIFEPQAIPAVVFTDPEIAWCGLTESQAKKENLAVEVAKFPWAASGRSLTLGRSDGLTKLIVDPETETILGMGIVGVGAGELIAEGVVAIEMGGTASDLKLCIHPHPTLSETIMESAEVFFGQSPHIYRPKAR